MGKDTKIDKEKPDITSINKEISELYEYALHDKSNKLKIICIGKVNSELADKIFNATNKKLQGYKICIDNYGILHTLKKHGNPVKEAKSGQIAVTKQDFCNIYSIVFNPDNVIDKGKSHAGNDRLVFEKTIENKYFVVKEVRKKSPTKKGTEKRLVFVTMFIRKIK